MLQNVVVKIAFLIKCNLFRISLGNEGEWSRKVIGYPEDYLMPCFIGIGKPSKACVLVEQKKIDIKERLYWNKW